jgi:hydrogenase maturation protease
MLCIVGCGNLTRSDDGVGVVVAQRLQAWLRQRGDARVRAFDAGTGGLDVMFQARGARKLVIVDACASGSEPGAIFMVPGHELEQLPEAGYSLHDFRWQHALAAGRRIFGADFPSDVTVFLIEAADLGFGLELTPRVQASAIKVAEQIEALAAAYQDAPDAGVVAGCSQRT